MRKRNLAIVVAGALLLLAAAAQEPHADVRILTHEQGDPAPRRIQAAIDLGVVAVSFLVTWTSKSLQH